MATLQNPKNPRWLIFYFDNLTFMILYSCSAVINSDWCLFTHTLALLLFIQTYYIVIFVEYAYAYDAIIFVLLLD